MSAANPQITNPNSVPLDASPSETAIATHGLGHRYGRRWAVRDLNMSVPRGSIYGFLGLNGAGKSTTMRMMMGLLPAHSGGLLVAGSDPASDPIGVKQRVGYVPDSPVFYDWMTIAETCALVARYRKHRWNNDRQKYLIRHFDLNPAAQTRSLSKGQRARLSLILALGFEPEILILDEPTLGLDPVARKQFTEGILREYAGEGKTVLISSHLIHEIAGLVDHVGIIKNSNLILQEPIETLQSRFRRVELYFEGGAPDKSPLDANAARYTPAGREAALVFNDWNPARENDLASTGATNIVISEMPLEDIFIETTGARDQENAHD